MPPSLTRKEFPALSAPSGDIPPSSRGGTASFGHAKVVDILLKAGANPALKNGEGYDALGLAKEYSKPAVVDLLQKHAGGKKGWFGSKM